MFYCLMYMEEDVGIYLEKMFIILKYECNENI